MFRWRGIVNPQGCYVQYGNFETNEILITFQRRNGADNTILYVPDVGRALGQRPAPGRYYASFSFLNGVGDTFCAVDGTGWLIVEEDGIGFQTPEFGSDAENNAYMRDSLEAFPDIDDGRIQLTVQNTDFDFPIDRKALAAVKAIHQPHDRLNDHLDAIRQL